MSISSVATAVLMLSCQSLSKFVLGPTASQATIPPAGHQPRPSLSWSEANNGAYTQVQKRHILPVSSSKTVHFAHFTENIGTVT